MFIHKSNRIPYPHAFLSRAPKVRTFMYRPRPAWQKELPGPGLAARLIVFAVTAMLAGVPLLSAFEAHMINVTAEIAQIDPPILTPAGPVAWDDTNGGTNLSGTVTVLITSEDEDATHIFYSFGRGLDTSIIPNPTCGQLAGPQSGGGPTLALPFEVSLTDDAVIKAVACDGPDPGSHASLINIKIYDFSEDQDLCLSTNVNFPLDLAVLAAGGAVANDDVTTASIVTINGDVRSNHNIAAVIPGAFRTINGNATASGTIHPSYTVTGVSTTGALPTNLPTIDIDTWQTAASAGGITSTDVSYPNNTSGTTLGPQQYNGNVTFGHNNSATITGPIYITGNLSLGANTTITQDISFGDTFAIIIVEGAITIGANVKFIASGSFGALLLVSKAPAQSGTAAAISTGANAELEDAVLFALNGDIRIGANSELLALFASHGTSASQPAIRLESNTKVNYRTLPTTIACGVPPPQPEIFITTDVAPVTETPVPEVAGAETESGGVEDPAIEKPTEPLSLEPL